jgi:hypothetical protein
MSKRSIQLAFLILVITCSARYAIAQEGVGMVIDASGDWVLGENQVIRKGRGLPPGGAIHRRSSSDADYIVIAGPNGKVIIDKRCSTAGACDRPIVLPKAAAPDQSISGRVMSALWGFWPTSNPERVEHGISRAPVKVPLQDAVVLLKNGSVDLSSPFKLVREGRYMVRLKSLAGNVTVNDLAPVDPFVYEWDPKNPSSLRVNELVPALYELTIFAPSPITGNLVPTADRAWLLISRPGTYEKNLSSFNDAVAITKEWGREVDRSAGQSFLREYLDYLSAKQGE